MRALLCGFSCTLLIDFLFFIYKKLCGIKHIVDMDYIIDLFQLFLLERGVKACNVFRNEFPKICA